MAYELWGLIILAVLGLVHASVQGLTLKSHVGNAWTVGARDKPVDPGIISARAERAKANFLETAPVFICLAVVIQFAGRANLWTDIGLTMYLAARIAYLPLYLVGIAWIRSFSWNIATVGLAIMMAGIFL